MQQIIDQLYSFLPFGKHFMFFYFIISCSIGLPSLVVLILAYMKSNWKALIYMIYLLLAVTIELTMNSYMEYQRVNLPFQTQIYEIVLIFCLQSLAIIFLPLLVNELFSITHRKQINYAFIILFGISLAIIIVPYFMGIYQGGAVPAFLGEKILIEALTGFKLYRYLLWSTYLYAFIIVISKIKTVYPKERNFYIGSSATIFLIFILRLLPVFKTFPENLFITVTGYFYINILLLKYIVGRFFADINVYHNSLSKNSADTLKLTEREKEILALLEQGLTNKNIGELLYISETTVKTHIQNIYKKVGAKNRVQLINLFKKSL